MRCPNCTQRNSVASRNCKFCGQKFKNKGPQIPLKALAAVGVAGVVVCAASALGSVFTRPDPKLRPVAERMAAGPKSAEDAQLMRVQLDTAVLKYLEQFGNISSPDLLTKLQSELPSSAFEVLVFDLPNKIKLVEVDCVLQPSDYLIVPSKDGHKVSRLAGLGVFDASRLLDAAPEQLLVLLGHTTGDGPRQPQLKALAILPSGEVSDRTDKVLPVIKGSGSANFIGTTSDIKVDRMLVSAAKDQKLFCGSIPFKDEQFITNLSWKNGRYTGGGSLGTGEFGALYAVASSLVDPTDADDYKQYLSVDVRDGIKGLEEKPVVAPGNFKIGKPSKETSKRRRKSDSDTSKTYILVSGKRAFEVSLAKSGRWSVTGFKETSAPAQIAEAEPEGSTAAAQPGEEVSKHESVEKADSKIVVKSTDETTKLASTDSKRERRDREAKREAELEARKAEEREERIAADKREKTEKAERIAEEKREKSQRAERIAEERRERAEKAERVASEKREKSERSSRRQNEQSGGSGTIVTETSSRVTMRSGPGRRNKTIFDVSRGEPVRILGEDNGWYKISVNGREGWIYGSYVNKGKLSKSTEVASKEKSEKSTSSKRSDKREQTTVASVTKSKSSKNRTQISSSKSHEGVAIHHDEPDFVP
ncbi:MAG: SH3 domain-containing protein [Candidatus Obscuribacterales bacterium]|nr:SH3 domain-containing protein [Candidatus Obscuribacterales bacterium]